MSVLSYGVQCLHLLQFGIQSHYPFTVWHLEPLSLLNFSIQSHHLFSVRHSESPYLLSYDIQRCQFSIMAFRATISLQLDVQKHHCFSFTMFRVVYLSLTFKDVSSQLWRSEPSSSSIWCSEPYLQLGVQSHYPFTV